MNAHVRGDETIKVALIGCGSRGTGAATQALHTKGPVKLWAMADLFADRLETSLAALTQGREGQLRPRGPRRAWPSQIDVPPERRFVGFDAYRQAIDSGVDLVILASPPAFPPHPLRLCRGAGQARVHGEAGGGRRPGRAPDAGRQRPRPSRRT